MAKEKQSNKPVDAQMDEFHGMSRDEKEAALEKARSEYEAMERESLNRMHLFIDEKPAEFAKLVCEVALGKAERGLSNLFYDHMRDPDGKHVIDYMSRCYSDLATVLLAKINGTHKLNQNSEYISVAEWITSEAHEPRAYSFYFSDRRRLLETFFQKNEENFGYPIASACDLIYNGIPLFEKVEDGAFAKISYSNHDYIYLAQRGMRQDLILTGMFPDWAKKYYVKQEHLAAHKIFFHGDRPDDTANAALRLAFRRYINCEDTELGQSAIKASINRHNTKLLGLVEKVIARYYDDQNKAPPKQDVVVAWLKEEFKLSERAAVAVDIVSRPDESRGKN